ncbi:MAG TPA: hypothetical protein P5519_03060 [Spirochaetia bacterium]|nr:hypothetical protein [Spirochaetales bacterium]HPD80369.1 hypothetical protein [Spirochaetales bacterium]HQK34453.1 hypothetical protein [Spirochaetales bacterium]HRS64847.1 hypothetical protein [Spirochaetia bacterium]
MSDDIDPEIAALIGGAIEEYAPKGKPGSKQPGTTPPKPTFDTLFGNASVTIDKGTKGEFEVDLSKKSFDPVTKFEEAKINTYFDDPQYYQKVLTNEGEEAQRFHDALRKFLQTTDPKDKTVFRQQVIITFWNLAQRMVPKLAATSVPLAKQLFFRFGMALPTMLAEDQRQMFAKIIYKKERPDPVYYLDEWLRNVAIGHISCSSTDEVQVRQSDERTRLLSLLQKAQGKRDTAEAVLKARSDERKTLEQQLKDRVEILCEHENYEGFLHIPAPYTESQRKTMSEIMELLRKLQATDKELIRSAENFNEADADVEKINEKITSLGAENNKANLENLMQEFNTIRQMHKMCVGRQGNHFPILYKDYFHLRFNEIGTRENVIEALRWLESIDAEVFYRPYKNTMNRIEPYVILLPNYGDFGFCWEPFDKYNRHTSRARLAIPMYTRNLKLAVVYAAGDMRWQSAKERASHYWMEEGLTGNYYQWFTSQKMKGDVKLYFIQDYINWVMKESDGMQKLDKELRGIFWRYIPFTQRIKENLRDRSLTYKELYQRDINRSLSDGY